MAWRLASCDLPLALGATCGDEGVSFAVFSRHGERVQLCVFDETGDREVARLPLPCRSGDIHHGLLVGAGPGLRYGLRVEGPFEPGQGHRFDPTKLLIDPHATRIDRPFRWDPILAAPPDAGLDTAAHVPRCVVVDAPAALAAVREPTPRFIYELGVKSFTMRHPAIPDGLRGTLGGLQAEPVIAHLQRLGVSHVELMPVAAWMDERHLPPLGLGNAWGYNPVNFFALDPRLAPGGSADLQRLCALYAQAGIGVILDVVFNHTAESDEHGATIGLRGLDNAVYYRHAADDPGRFVNDTGCGNTLALDRAPVMRMAMDAMRHFRSLGVAGFRFDLGTVMGRSDTGFSQDAPLLGAMAQDPALAGAILIAEPWDIGPGGYRLGEFPAPFAEWNGRYRDDVRRFWRGDAGLAGSLATRLAGSADLYAGRHRGPDASINFVCAHDGFTLADLVSFATKHNDANGEGNRDGDNDSHSWNNGAEGPSDDPAIATARRGDVRALLATLFVSRGIPMLQAGDEFGRSQHGNNNAYCQDNADFWMDWENADDALIGFVAELAKARKEHPLLGTDGFLSGTGTPPDALWLKTDGTPIADHEWQGLDALCLALNGDDESLLIALNRGREPVAITLPGTHWHRVLVSVSDAQDGSLPARSLAIYAGSAPQPAQTENQPNPTPAERAG